ncbi:MAG: HEPN domain-containing protein [Candidatus Bathyarchaeia archaeon]|jgi:hypothetical protein
MSSSVSPRITLPVIENAIRSCETHLNSSGARGSEIESYLTRYLLILICGEYEKLIKEKVVERARRASDPDLASFVERTVKSFRGLRISEIKGGVLRKFSDNHVAMFDQKTKNTEAIYRYSNIVENRHMTAHGQTVNMTFSELVTSFRMAESILISLSEVLSM